MTIEQIKKQVAKKYNLGNTLVTGHMTKYFEEVAEIYAQHKVEELIKSYEKTN